MIYKHVLWSKTPHRPKFFNISLIKVEKNDLEQDTICIQLPNFLEKDLQFRKNFVERLSSVLRIKPDIEFVEEAEILKVKHQETKRKPTFFLDNR